VELKMTIVDGHCKNDVIVTIRNCDRGCDRWKWRRKYNSDKTYLLEVVYKNGCFFYIFPSIGCQIIGIWWISQSKPL